jgi:hypothetical protein
MTILNNSEQLRKSVDEVVSATPVVDMHTHLFAPQFGKMNLWGIDELLNYHYLIAELFRSSQITHAQFFELSSEKQADLIWKTLFVENTPLSEATRGVVAVLSRLELDTTANDLREIREYYRSQKPDQFLKLVLELSGVTEVVMTNDPLDDTERAIWEQTPEIDSRFHAALRMDPMLNDWEVAYKKFESLGYKVDAKLSGQSVKELRRFVDEWIGRMKPSYMAVSLPGEFQYPEESARGRIIDEVVMPASREHKVPFAMMIGVKRAVNPALRLAGDGLRRCDIGAVERICAAYPENRFLISILSRENQHELCVVARKFNNLMPFGCWWFLNNPSIIEEMTYERVELLGPSFIPQHSDARVLDQLIYKWQHSRRVISSVLYDSYNQLLQDGRAVTRSEIERDVKRMFSGNFKEVVR